MHQVMSHPFQKCFKRLEVNMVKGAQILCAGQENGIVTIYVEVNTEEKEMVLRKFIIIDSGESFEKNKGIFINKIFINHVMTDDGIEFLYELL